MSLLSHIQGHCRPGRCRGLHPPSALCGWSGSGSHLSVQCLGEEQNDHSYFWSCDLWSFSEKKRNLKDKCHPSTWAIIRLWRVSQDRLLTDLPGGFPENSTSKCRKWAKPPTWTLLFIYHETDWEIMWVLCNSSGRILQAERDRLCSPESSTRVSLSLNQVICGGGFANAVQATSMVSPVLVVWFSRFPVITGAMRSVHIWKKKTQNF